MTSLGRMGNPRYLWRWRCLTWWREVVVVSEECGDEYILPEYTMNTPSTKLYITAAKLPTPKHPRTAKRFARQVVCHPFKCKSREISHTYLILINLSASEMNSNTKHYVRRHQTGSRFTSLSRCCRARCVWLAKKLITFPLVDGAQTSVWNLAPLIVLMFQN